MKPIIIVQGAQFGSESKGAVAHALAQRLGVRWAVRTGSINAGHSIVVNGRKLAFCQLPTAVVLPSVRVVLGPGAYLHEDTLHAEAEVAGCADRLYIDYNCGVHLDDYAAESKADGRTLRIGATGKGCAEAIIHKIADRGRGTSLLFRDLHHSRYAHLAQHDTAALLNDAYDRGEPILLEGTQGSLLDFHCGPYPFVTSRQTTAAAWVTEAGLSPALSYEVVLVVRTYPIRVAGNSGPMPNEIDWPTLARRINVRLTDHGREPLVCEDAITDYELALKKLAADWRYQGRSDVEIALYGSTEVLGGLPESAQQELAKLFETTTVTKRLRRIAEIDVEQLRLTVRKERPAYIALTFLNYIFPELAGARELHAEAIAYLEDLQQRIGCWIRYTSVGPSSDDLLETPVALYRSFS